METLCTNILYTLLAITTFIALICLGSCYKMGGKQYPEHTKTTRNLKLKSKWHPSQSMVKHASVTKQVFKQQHTLYPMNIIRDVSVLRDEAIRLTELFHLDLFQKHDNIASYCKYLGLKTNEFVGDRGIIASLTGPQNGLCMGLACVISNTSNEQTEFESLCCDCHSAILLTTANVLCSPKYSKQAKGSVKFIFDPAEKADSIISNDLLGGLDQIYGFCLKQDYLFGTIVVTVNDNDKNNDQFIRNAFNYIFKENDNHKYILNRQKTMFMDDKYSCFIEIGCGNEINCNCLIFSIQLLMDLVMDIWTQSTDT